MILLPRVLGTYNWGMASITIELDEATMERLRKTAAELQSTVEEEARRELQQKISGVPGNLADRIRKRVEPYGFLELPEIKRGPGREPPNFE